MTTCFRCSNANAPFFIAEFVTNRLELRRLEAELDPDELTQQVGDEARGLDDFGVGEILQRSRWTTRELEPAASLRSLSICG